jgi:hydroxyisourate hydrolase
MTLSTHVLDVDAGRPAAGIPVAAERHVGGHWVPVATGSTDANGRVGELVGPADWGPGRWRLVFFTEEYLGTSAFWPEITMDFVAADASHHHVPLLLARHGYTTYRGS